VRRYVDLTRPEIIRLLATNSTAASVECAAAIRGGAAFRVHEGTVTRDGALRIYGLRADAMRLNGTAALGVQQALKDLGDASEPLLRIAAVSGGRLDFTLFLDPECRILIACLGFGGQSWLPAQKRRQLR
jgi:hypothetical protein